jgi:hypothetical protein
MQQGTKDKGILFMRLAGSSSVFQKAIGFRLALNRVNWNRNEV